LAKLVECKVDMVAFFAAVRESVPHGTWRYWRLCLGGKPSPDEIREFLRIPEVVAKFHLSLWLRALASDLQVLVSVVSSDMLCLTGLIHVL
jgi:hypothetical protein